MSKLKQLTPPDLIDLLNLQKREILSEINCVQVGIIQSFNAAEQTASVSIALKKVKDVLPDGTRILEEHPLLLECPVIILYGGAGYMTMPISQGDNCLVLFNDREIDNWFVNGGVQTPATFRTHDFSDAIALVGLRSLQTSIANYLSNGIRLSYTGSKIDLVQNQINTMASLFQHTGNMEVTGNFTVGGNTNITGELDASIIRSGNGATGTFNIVNVQDGIVVSGS